MTREEKIAHRKKNIIGYEELFNSPRREVIGFWLDAEEREDDKAYGMAMMVMEDTQDIKMKKEDK